MLGYKPDKPTSFEVKRQFQIISAQLQAVDEHFDLLFHQLLHSQEHAKYKDSDLLTAEILPAVLSDIGTGCAQKEIDGLLKLLTSRGLRDVQTLRAVATPSNIELIRNVFVSHEARHAPTNFEIVASLAAIRGSTDFTAAIKTQIDFLRAWEELRGQL